MTKIKLTHHESTPVPEEVGVVVVQLEQHPGKLSELEYRLVEVFKVREQLCYRFLDEAKVRHIDEWAFKIWDDGK